MKASRAVLCLAAGQTILWAGLYYIFPALLLRWEAAQGWSKTSLTAAFAAAMVAAAFFSPIAGRLIDKGQGPKIMAGSALAGAALVALLPLAGSVWSFAAIWLLIGAAMGGCLYEPCFALITRTRGIGARRAITLVTLVAGFASTLSFPLNHWIAGAFGWQAATLGFAALMAACGAPLTWAGARHLEAQWQARQADAGSEAPTGGRALSDRISRNSGQSPAAEILRYPAFWFLAAGFSLLAFNHGVVLNHLLPILQDRGVHPDTAVFAASMIGPMQVAGRLAMMLTEHRVSSRAITSACFIAVITATACLFAASASPLLIALFVILQGSGNGVSSIMKPVMVREILGEKNFGTISGLTAVPFLLAFALSPFLGSLLWQLGGYALALITVGVFGALGFCCYLLALHCSPVRQ